ncbi:MAG: MarR family transcriptional regulator [Patescibacteria group bacterium]|nr:MarR family transcriptional regulator [Patescibacteria group bacterium]MDD4610646.1 MarR family transcriptional regulator [Patescibacteria group bacterium]
MPDELTNSLVSLIFSTGQMLRERAMQEGKINPGAFMQIVTLDFIRKNSAVTMKELVEFLHIKPPSVTSIANNLAKEKLITRVTDQTDRRVVKLSLTKQGENFLKEKSKIITEQMKKSMSVLDEGDKKNLIKIFKKLSHINK